MKTTESNSMNITATRQQSTRKEEEEEVHPKEEVEATS